ncbi:uncharacterized protein ColSpa_09970 [Colletotrichum spaethianum]|uniref:Uncharacterized protein n=1 Tax=Colletotrichum spaethianum TaxID=700344 RepID=A0AA37PCQ8_9PEZI|nr:uncharacterized protein ColSpa_09970 [Colletotrichum spaethianum]GKT49789.1 hypothetical protein ColSpa_09970 [Colletotrichum spaethianum]
MTTQAKNSSNAIVKPLPPTPVTDAPGDEAAWPAPDKNNNPTGISIFGDPAAGRGGNITDTGGSHDVDKLFEGTNTPSSPKESPISLSDRDDNRADDAASLSNENNSSNDNRDSDSDEEDSDNKSIQMVDTPTPAHNKAGRSNRRGKASNYHRSLKDTISALDREIATTPDNELHKEILVIFNEFFKKKSKQKNSNTSFVTNNVVHSVKEACQRARDTKMTSISGWSAKLPSHAQVLAVRMLHKNRYLVKSIGRYLTKLQRSSLAQVKDTRFTGGATSGTPTIKTLLQ